MRTIYLWSGRSRLPIVEVPSIEGELMQEASRMALLNSFLKMLRREDEGQGLAEYALILALIAIIAIIALIFLGGQVSSILSTVGNSV